MQWSIIEPKIAPVLKLNLMLHQQHAICWMLQMESLGGFGINSILWEEREFLDGGKYYYSPALGQIRLSPPPVMKGGILADEQGLGKTLEVLGLIVASLHELEQEAAHAKLEEKANLTPTHATLIIVPPALVSQWHAEVRKAVGDALIVHYFDPETLLFVCEGTRVRADPDIVITTYAALQKSKSSRKLSSFSWGRIVLDEMQEIRSSTTKIAKNCDNLVCQRRWMLSGTPLFDGIDDLRGELQFLRLSPFAAGLEDGFFKFSITSHWHNHSLHCLETLRILGLLILRRSKSMTIAETKQPLMGLKPLTVEFVPIPQDPSERALYCFLESIVSRLLKGDKEKTAHASRTNCLTKLREMCISAVSFTVVFYRKEMIEVPHTFTT
jgi:SNF2 family DNA or RNA helicase